MRCRTFVASLLILATVLSGSLGALAEDATPAISATLAEQPSQPATGPGGAEFSFDGIRAQHYGPEPDGSASPTGFWLFEPIAPRSDAPPAAQSALPLVIFLHGYTATDPEIYHAWIDHLVRRGAIVVYPDWQPWDYGQTNNAETLSDTMTAITSALAELRTGDHDQPDLERVALVGHSFGGMLAIQYAAVAAAESLPIPQAILLASPGCWSAPFQCGPTPPVADLSTVPATSRFLILAKADDPIVGNEPAQLWSKLSTIPLENRDFITYVGDAHGAPTIEANHDIPATTLNNPLDAYDWYGTWKWLDALMTCSFANEDCQYALGNTPEQRFMGIWSDGVPVAEPIVTEDPAGA